MIASEVVTAVAGTVFQLVCVRACSHCGHAQHRIAWSTPLPDVPAPNYRTRIIRLALVNSTDDGWCEEHGGDTATCPPCQQRKGR